MTTPEQPHAQVPAEVAARVDAARDRTAALALRAASLQAQVADRLASSNAPRGRARPYREARAWVSRLAI